MELTIPIKPTKRTSDRLGFSSGEMKAVPVLAARPIETRSVTREMKNKYVDMAAKPVIFLCPWS
jgi:hypothetical protein